MNIKEIMKTWTPAFSEAAQREGWDLFTDSTMQDNAVQVQRFDDQQELERISPGAPFLRDDAEAMMMVRTGTGDHHREARRIIYDNFPEEWALLDKAAASVIPPHDMFIERAAQVFGIKPEDVTEAQRKQIRALTFFTNFGGVPK